MTDPGPAVPSRPVPIGFPFADTHFHSLSMSQKGIDVEAAYDRAVAAGLAFAVDVGVTPGSLAARRAVLPDRPTLVRSTGIGPSHSAGDWSAPLATLREELESRSFVAIGEIGLDFYRDYGPRSAQIELFDVQLALASRYALPVIVHNRKADDATVERLAAAKLERGGVMHCFSSDAATARRCLDLGFLISFAGNVTFKSSAELRAVAADVPGDRLLVETDSPYLSPEPFRGTANTPENVPCILKLLAELRKAPVAELASLTLLNARRLFVTDRG
jgi:TatD DNase family protein